VSARYPVHVTLKVRAELHSLRTHDRAQIIRAAFAETCNGDGFRIIDWSIQGSHIHLVVEADSNLQLSRGMKGFCVRVARGLNRLASRDGTVFSERYHLHMLRTPSETRAARCYVIQNRRRHLAQIGRRLRRGWVDPHSSWAFFDGWRDLPPRLEGMAAAEREGQRLAAQPQSWLLRVGWRRLGLVSVNETPAACRS
jgi:REP element-mobilizing transposase RayT